MTIARFAEVLESARIEASPPEVAEVLWLAQQISGAETSPASAATEAGSPGLQGSGAPAAASAGEDRAELYVPRAELAETEARPAIPVRAPAPPALPGGLDILRALQPLKRRVPAARDMIMDEDATADQIAANTIAGAGRGALIPVLRPAPERWLALAIVVDAVPSMSIWCSLIGELRQLAEQLGAFRDVRIWYLHAGPVGAIGIHHREQPDSPLRDPRALMDPSGRLAVLLVSDCVDARWRDGRLDEFLRLYGRAGPLAIGQPLPQRLWRRCAVRPVPVVLRAVDPGQPNTRLLVARQDELGAVPDGRAWPPVPMLELGPNWLGPWARLVAGQAYRGIDAVLAESALAGPPPAAATARDGQPDTARQMVARFRAVASPDAYRLACYLSVVPLTLPVMRIVQSTMLPKSRPAHLAEVFVSGLLQDPSGPAQPDPELRQYEFAPGVRDVLLGAIRRSEALRVSEEVSAYVARHFGQVRDMAALVAAPSDQQTLAAPGAPFATVPASVARRLAMTPDSRPTPAPDPQPVPALGLRSTPDLEQSARQTATPGRPRRTMAADYLRLVHEVTGWRGVFPLGIAIRVGDYFELRSGDDSPVLLGNAFDWPGWQDATQVESEVIASSASYFSGCHLEIDGHAEAGTLSLSFSRTGGFTLAYEAATRIRVRDLPSVTDLVLDAARSGRWQENWILAVEVIAAESATLIVAADQNFEFDLHANAAIPPALSAASIADPTLGWTASRSTGSGYSSVCQRGTPLYHGLKLRKSWIGRNWRTEIL